MSLVHVLANPAAAKGRAAAQYRDTLHELESQGAQWRELDARSIDAARAGLRAVASTENSRVIVVGGDGLVHLALQELATTNVPVGIIAAGTGNDFAHALKLDHGTLRDRVARALAPTKPVDAIRTTHGWVASVATIGFAADVNARANAMSWPKGRSRYTVATLALMARLHPVKLTLVLDGEPIELSTTLLAVGNTAYFGGGMAICPGALADDGLLDIAVIGDVRTATFARVFPQVFRGRHVTHPACRMFRAARVQIHNTAVDLWGDGERVGPAPVDLEAVRGAILIAGAS